MWPIAPAQATGADDLSDHVYFRQPGIVLISIYHLVLATYLVGLFYVYGEMQLGLLATGVAIASALLLQ
jgi:hypothetical protein